MFEKAILRREIIANNIDVGLLAETLLFYQRTHIILDYESAVTLVSLIGLESFCRLLKDRHATIGLFSNLLGTETNRDSGLPLHKFVQFRLLEKVQKKFDPEAAIHQSFVRHGTDANQARAATNAILRFSTPERTTLSGKNYSLSDLGHSDLLDQRYVDRAARSFIEGKVPGFKVPPNWRFVPHAQDGGTRFFIETNYDFAEINRALARFNTNEAVYEGNVLTDIFDVRADMFFASKHMSEMVTSPARSNTLAAKFDGLTLRRDRHQQDIDLFSEIQLEGRSLRESLNKGERSFAEFLDLLDKAAKFKGWLADADPEKGLIKEYNDAVTKDTWVDKIPAKLLRFVSITGAGLALDALVGGGAGVAGIAIGFADTMLLDRMLKGWRPNQFVGRLADFTDPAAPNL